MLSIAAFSILFYYYVQWHYNGDVLRSSLSQFVLPDCMLWLCRYRSLLVIKRERSSHCTALSCLYSKCVTVCVCVCACVCAPHGYSEGRWEGGNNGGVWREEGWSSSSPTTCHPLGGRWSLGSRGGDFGGNVPQF